MFCKSMDLRCDDVGLWSDRWVFVVVWMLWEAKAQLWPVVASAKRKAIAGAGIRIVIATCSMDESTI